MKLQQYQDVILKDGKEGCIVEVWSDTDFEVDIGSSPADWETITVNIKDIDLEATKRLAQA